jgi:hypothetical protein
MSNILPIGKLTWKRPADMADVVGFEVFQSIGQPPTKDSDRVAVGDVEDVALPITGLPLVEGEVFYAVASVDKVGNTSDFLPFEPVMVDLIPPPAPTDAVFVKGF